MNFGRINTFFLRLSHKFGVFWPLVIGFCAFCLVFLFGFFIYMGVEGWNFTDSFYQIIITLSTVGFQETNPISNTGRILTAILIMMGVGGFFLLMASFTRMIIEGRLQMLLWRRKMQKIINTLKDHFIVCGYGRIGRVVVQEVLRQGHFVVVVEKNPELVQELEKEDILVVSGDATREKNLLAAGLTNARVLITALNHEADNVYVALTGRQLVPKLQIIARAEDQASTQKLEFAGADRVLAPHVIGGLRMAQMVLRPTVTDFLELAEEAENLELEMEELVVSKKSNLVDKDLIQSEIRPKFNLIVIAMKKASGQMLFNPKPQTVIQEGDTLVVLGRKDDLEDLETQL
jgi:voltage-gated potassium channel